MTDNDDKHDKLIRQLDLIVAEACESLEPIEAERFRRKVAATLLPGVGAPDDRVTLTTVALVAQARSLKGEIEASNRLDLRLSRLPFTEGHEPKPIDPAAFSDEPIVAGLYYINAEDEEGDDRSLIVVERSEVFALRAWADYYDAKELFELDDDQAELAVGLAVGEWSPVMMLVIANVEGLVPLGPIGWRCAGVDAVSLGLPLEE